jgi:hypothetical protein
MRETMKVILANGRLNEPRSAWVIPGRTRLVLR